MRDLTCTMYEMITWKLLMTMDLLGEIQQTALVMRTLPRIPRTACWILRSQVMTVQSEKRGTVSRTQIPTTEMTRPPTANQKTRTE